MKRLLFLSLFLFLPFRSEATILWSNNAGSTISNVGGITSGATSLSVGTGEGDEFPITASPDYFIATISDTLGNREIIKVTTRSSGSDTFTIERGQESTTPRAWNQGDYIQQRITAGSLDEFSTSLDYHQAYYACDATAADQAATDNDSSLASLVATIGSVTNATIMLPHSGTGATTEYTVLQNLDLSDYTNIDFIIERGAFINYSANTLTIPNPIASENSRIFSGTATVTITNAAHAVYPEWWGAVGDGATNDQPEIQEAVDCGTDSNIPIIFKGKTYAIADSIDLRTGSSIIGKGIDKTIFLRISGGGTDAAIDAGTGVTTKIILKDFTLDCDGIASVGGIRLTSQDETSLIQNVRLVDYAGTNGIQIVTPSNMKIYNLFIDTPSYGGTNDFIISNGDGIDVFGLTKTGSVAASTSNIEISGDDCRLYGVYLSGGLNTTQAIHVNKKDNNLIDGLKIITSGATTFDQLISLDAGSDNNVFRDVNIEKGGSSTITNIVVDSDLSITIPYDSRFSGYVQPDYVKQQFVTLANEATPSVSIGNNFLTGGTTTITNLDNGVEGQIANILLDHSVVFSGGNNLNFINQTEFSGASGDSLTMVQKSNGKWYELNVNDHKNEIVQVAYTSDGIYSAGAGVIVYDDSTPQSNEGNRFLTQTITPTNSSNILEIEALLNLACSASGTTAATALFQDSSNDAVATTWEGRGNAVNTTCQTFLKYRMAAGTTSSTTFKLNSGCASGTTYFNGSAGAQNFNGTMASYIKITEYQQ